MKTISTLSRWGILFTISLVLSGCFIRPYKFDITQGNVITADKVDQIHSGMSPDQVRYVLGTPMLQDIFHTNRWDYVYYEKPGHGDLIRKHLVIVFENGRVASLSKDKMPEEAVA